MTSKFFNRKRASLLIGVVATLGLALSACSSPGTDSTNGATDGGDKELTTVRVAFNPGTCLQLYAAVSAGLFEKHGLDVELIQFENGAAANAAYASNGVDLGYSGIPGVFAARTASDNTRIFMIDNDGYDAGGLVAGKDSGIKSVKDLEGKTVGTVIGTTSWMALMTALDTEGVDPSAVNIQNVGPAAWVPALENGDVDAIWGWAPLIFTMEEAGHTIVATDSTYQLNPLLWQARGPFMDEHPDAVEAFVAAYAEAAPLVVGKDAGFISTMMEKSGADKATVEKTVSAVRLISVEDTLDKNSPYSFTSPKGMKAILDRWLKVLTENKIITETPDLEGFIDPSALEAYVASKN